jgi:hypothetical protein
MIAKFTARVLKNAGLLRSFVVEETALADLLTRSWQPTLKKIKKQLSPVVNFKTGYIVTDKALAFELWVTPEMFSEDLEIRWGKIAPTAEKYLRKSYRRAFSEQGKAPSDADFSLDRTFESDDLLEATEDEDASVLPLLNMIREGFLTYLETDALPGIKQAVTALHQLQLIEDVVRRENGQAAAVSRDAVAKYDKEVLNYEQCRVAKVTLDFAAWRVDTVESARASVKDTLADILAGNTPKSSMLANLAVARAHNFGFLDWAWRSGVDYYKISSVLDNRVCAACLAMNGKVFSVRDGMKFRERFLSVVGDKNRMKQVVPFLTKDTAEQTTGLIKHREQIFGTPRSSFARDPESGGTVRASTAKDVFANEQKIHEAFPHLNAVDLYGMDKNLASFVADELIALGEAYPDVMRHLQEIVMHEYNPEASEIAITSPDGKIIAFGSDYWQQEDRLNKELIKAAEIGELLDSKGNSGKYILAHEFGHVFKITYAQATSEYLTESHRKDLTCASFFTRYIKEIFQAGKGTELSLRAQINEDEFTAELFAAARLGGASKKIVRDFGEFMTWLNGLHPSSGMSADDLRSALDVFIQKGIRI